MIPASTRSHVTIIEPGRQRPIRLARELFAHRDLVRFLAVRDVRVRYKQTALGFAWVVIQPAALMIVFWLFLGRVARVPSDGVSYPLFVFSGLIPWTFFSQSVLRSSGSIVNHAGLISKVYFPRLALPIASVLSHLPDASIGTMLAVAGAAIYGSLSFRLSVIPIVIGGVAIAALAVGMLLSGINARFRDIAQGLPLLIQVWMFATPVVYPASLIPSKWQGLLALNPMTSAVEAFRWALLGESALTPVMLAASIAVVLVLSVVGIVVFAHAERGLADVV